MVDVLKSVSTRKTPQTRPAGGATTKNAAGGYVFAVDRLPRLRRFLTLGSEGGTYYTKPETLTRENADIVINLAKSDAVTLVDEIVAISLAGRAPKQNPAIFALAIAASEADEAGRAYALAALPKVCRTGSALYQFVGYVEQFRGWGPALKRAVANWYLGRPVDKLAYQALKYRQRDGWAGRDLLRLSRPAPDSAQRDALFAYMVGSASLEEKRGDLPSLVDAFEQVQNATVAQAVELIQSSDLSWEMLPDNLVTDADVWGALLVKGVPQTALMRQLPRLTKLGLTTGSMGKVIAKQLADPVKLKQGRVHPINVLVAQRTYASGQSARGDGTWTPSRLITDALDAAFYAAYGAVEAYGKRILLACDVSGSMSASVSGLPISCREAVAALSLVTMNVEQDCEVIGFSDGGRTNGFGFGRGSAATRLDISPRRRLDDVCSYMSRLGFTRTDCALPMIWADQNKLDFDAIWVLTDNETYFGSVHPWQALKSYREKYGPTQFGVVSMTATGGAIADPADPASLDIAGFDSNVPQVISQFSAGLI